MNKRIKELAIEARLLTGWPVGEVEYQKFGELIVQECANLFPLTFTDEQYQRRIDKTIRKHFGIT